jgi:hypothetical protein
MLNQHLCSVLITAYSKRNGTYDLTTSQEDWRALRAFLRRQTPSTQRVHREGFRGWCAARAIEKKGWWANCTTFLYLIHVIVLLYVTKRRSPKLHDPNSELLSWEGCKTIETFLFLRKLPVRIRMAER